nr:hypothetical protein [Tanacetum cinerariifolium]
YLQEFWYSAEADSAMKTITFTLSCFDKPLSFDLDVFSTVIGLSPGENYVSVPLKEIVKAGLATLGLFDEKHLQLSSSTTFKPTLKNKFALTAHMCKVAELSLDPIKSLLLPSGEVNVDETADKSLSRTSVQLVNQSKASTVRKPKKKKKPHLQPNQRLCNLSGNHLQPHMSLRLSLLRKQWPPLMQPKEKVNESGLESMGDVTFDQIMDEINQKNKAAQENLRARVEPSHFKYDQTKLTKHGDSDSGLCSMPDDDLVSLTSFENPESTNNDSQAGTAENFNASADMPDQSDPLGHLHEELCTLNTKVDQLEFDISKKVIKDSIKQSVLDSIEEKLHVFDAQVKQTLQDQRPNILKLMNKQFNAFNTMESRRFVTLQYELSKVIKTKLGVLVRNKDLKLMFRDMVLLFESSEVFKKANADGDK